MPVLRGSCTSGGPCAPTTWTVDPRDGVPADKVPDLPYAGAEQEFRPTERPTGQTTRVSGMRDTNTRRRVDDIKDATARLATHGQSWSDTKRWASIQRSTTGRRRWTDADLAAANIDAITAYCDILDHTAGTAHEESA